MHLPRLQNLNWLLYALALVVLVAQAAAWHPLFELLSHFILQYALVALVLSAAFLFHKATRPLCLLGIAIAAFCGFQVLPLLHAPVITASNTYEDINILQYNTYFKLKDFSDTVRWIQSQPDLDVLVLQEATPLLERQAQPLLARYPYRLLKPQPNAQGMLILSKLPMRSKAVKPFDQTRNHYSIIELETLKRRIPFTMIETHTTSPSGLGRSDRRNRELQILGEVAASVPALHRVLIGDFNVTPYSPQFKTLIQDSHLRNAMLGKQWLGTWPRLAPNILRIPIDHLLVSERIDVLARSIGPPSHSDHLPVITVLRIYEK